MSTELITDPKVAYERLLRELPVDIRMIWHSDDCEPPVPVQPSLRNWQTRRCFVVGIVHCLLEDACGNSIWLRKATDGSALFEQFGLQGQLEHFGQAITKAFAVDLIDEVTTLPWDDGYFGALAGTGRCRSCEKETT